MTLRSINRAVVALVFLLTAATAASAQLLSVEEESKSEESSSSLHLSCGDSEYELVVREPDPTTEVDDFVVELDGVQDIDGFPCMQGYHSGAQICACAGESSESCDKLFEACDESGGLFGCASDLGSDQDTCTCEA